MNIVLSAILLFQGHSGGLWLSGVILTFKRKGQVQAGQTLFIKRPCHKVLVDRTMFISYEEVLDIANHYSVAPEVLPDIILTDFMNDKKLVFAYDKSFDKSVFIWKKIPKYHTKIK